MIIGGIIFIAAYFGARVLNEKALKHLSLEQKGELITAFSKTRIWSMVILVVIILGFLLLTNFVKIDSKLNTLAYFGALLLYMLVLNIMTQVRLRKLQFPAEYIRLNMYAMLLRYLGLVAVVLSLYDMMVTNLSALEKTI